MPIDDTMPEKPQTPVDVNAIKQTVDHVENFKSLEGVHQSSEGFSIRRHLFAKVDNSAFFQEALATYGKDGDITPEAEKKLLRKIDWIILPLISHRQRVSLPSAFPLLHPKDLVFMALSIRWLVWAIPANLLLQRSPPGAYLSVCILLWGGLLMAQAGAKKFIDLAVLRILSGAFESIADPAFMLFTTMFYTRAEQPTRISIWYAFNGVGVAFGGLLGYAIGHIKGSLPSWKYEFLVVGAVCSFIGLLFLFFLPNSPATTWWLTREQRLMAIARLKGNQTGVENRTFKMDQFIEAFTDIKTYLFLIFGFMSSIPTAGASNFSTLIIQGLGYDALQTALLGIPQGAFIALWILLGAWINNKLPPNSRTIVSAMFMIPTIAGTLGFLLVPEQKHVARLICFYLTGSYQTAFVLFLSLITSNTGGQTKKMILAAVIWLGACTGNISGPFFFKASQAPNYRLGIGAMLTANCLEFVVILLMRFILARANKKRDEQKARMEEAGLEGFGPSADDTAFADLTDKQNLHFRYVY
ncbi:hypothetical protein MNV49_005220 [Pseudohyphozyma bogoriensis]|nr:hypothetical protein MNV49_005220 [Pseudohyphozyma bogoriensis]